MVNLTYEWQGADPLTVFCFTSPAGFRAFTGRYDFNLDYSIEELRNLVRSFGGDASRIPDSAGDPSASIFSSLEGIGLKLDPRKAPVEVLVIDHAERVPTAN